MALVLINLLAAAFMAGVIWFVQVVHYPLMARVGREGFVPYEEAHARLTTWVVAPVMLVEAVTAVLLVIAVPDGVDGWTMWLGLGAVVALWLSTALVQVPAHARLAKGFDAEAHRRLVVSNWFRTALWSGRAALLAWAALGAASTAH